MKDKLFFFAAQEWVSFKAIQTNTATVPTAKMRTGDFSELLDPSNQFFNGARVITDPTTGQAFPGNVIPSGRLSPNGLAMLNAYPLPTPNFRQGANNAIISSDNPQDQRKDNIRFDYRPTERNQFTYRYGQYSWTAVDAFGGTFPYARSSWSRPNRTQTASWTSTITSKLVNEFSFTNALDEVFINVFRGTDLFERSKYGINYPYIFPENKEIPDKIPTISIDTFSELNGGPYPASSRGPIYTFNNATSYLAGRHTIKAGIAVEYSGQDDFDQINVQPIPGSTNNQNGRFQFTNASAGANSTGTGVANAALGLFTNYAEIGQRAFTKYRSLATDLFVQDSWRPASNITVEGGVRWAYWPPWYSLTNNIATFDPGAYSTTNEAVIDRTTGRVLSGPRYNGVILPGDGFPDSASDLAVYNDPVVNALFAGGPRGFAKTHKNVFEPRLGMAYSLNQQTILKASAGVFHNRVTVSDSMFLGGNPPFQPQVGVSNGLADNPGGVGGAASLPLGHDGHRQEFKHPTAYMWSVGVQRQMPLSFILDVTYVGRRGLYLAARARHQPGAARYTPGQPGRQHRSAATLQGLRRHPTGRERRLLEVREPPSQRGSPLQERLPVRPRLHARPLAGQRQRQARRAVQQLRRFRLLGQLQLRPASCVQLLVHLRPAVLSRPERIVGKVLGGWQLSGSTFMRSGTPLWVTESVRHRRHRRHLRNPWNLNGDPKGNANEEFSAGAAADQNFWFDPDRLHASCRGTFGNGPRYNIYNPGQYQWDIALFKNVGLGGTRTRSSAPRSSTS